MEHLPCNLLFVECNVLKLMIPSSNGGVFGSLYGTPIINLPQAAVLGLQTFRLLV